MQCARCAGMNVPEIIVEGGAKLCQPNLEMSSSSQSRNVRFMFRSSPSVRLVLTAIVCATDGLVSV